ncbi:transcriptional regulator LysR family [Vibrio variabilis]|uniref:Transcriptional regulator LysR family n=1 Tax=Vibrio variabilis TaxID=990271 RepID=A0ABQ0JB50_9VIBR|nr:transcriptional regulator LysR family [Vibrio variabilis]
MQRWFVGLEKLEPFEASGTLYSNNAETLVSAAIGGSGIVVFPSWLIGEHVKDGSLVAIMEDYNVSTSAEPQVISALYLDTDNLAAKVRVVIDFLEEKFIDNNDNGLCYWDAR